MKTRIAMVVTGAMIALTAQAGVVMETAERNPGAEAVRNTNVLRAEGGKLRMERYEKGKLVGLMIFSDDAIHALDPEDKTYAVIDRASIEKIAAAVNPALAQMREQLEKMSPEQRAMVEQMMKGTLPGGMGDKPPPVRAVKKTSRTDKVAGLPCAVTEMLEDGKLKREACVAPKSSVPGGQEFYDALSHMGALMQEMMDAIDSPWIKQSVDEQWASVEKLDGVPIRSVEYEDGKPTLEVVLTRIAEEAAPAGSFDIPDGYTQRNLGAM
jgi:hypothetical protein